MKNVVVDSISRYTDGDVYKHHIFGVFVVNDFKKEKIFINVFIVYLFVVSVAIHRCSRANVNYCEEK